MTTQALRPVKNTPSGPEGASARRPPHDAAIERAVIGAALLRGAAVLEVADTVTPEDFWSPLNGRIWQTITDLVADGETVDPVTVAHELTATGILPADTAIADLAAIQVDGVNLGGIGSYLDRLTALSGARRLIAIARELTESGYEGDLDRAQQILLSTAAEVADKGRPSLLLEDVASVVRGELPDIVPTILHRTDGQALVYPGLTHSFAGEPAAGKTWIALIATAQLLGSQRGVVYLDYEGNRRIVGQRLMALGVDPGDVEAHFCYLRPPEIGPAQAHELARLLDARRPHLAVIDGIARAIARQGGDEDHAADVLGFIETVCRPLTTAGAAVIMLDHVTKAREGRGRWARGSGSKLGEIEGAAYGIEVAEPFTRTRPGSARMVVTKDREGIVGADGDDAATISFTPGPAGRLVVRVEPPQFASVHVDQAVLRALEERGEMAQSKVIQAVRDSGERFRDETIIVSLENLAVSRRILARGGGGRGKTRIYSPLPKGANDIAF